MSSDNFYNILGVDADSRPEDIRKAYKKRALQTHPDRLPQGSTLDDKKYAEEQFRKVNNAYEILSDANKRRLYDLYGTWPPPEELPEYRRAGAYDGHHSSSRARPQNRSTHPFYDPFFQPHPMFHPPPSFAYTDPFELFNSFFAEFNHDPFGGFNGFPAFPSHFNRPSLFGSAFPSMRHPSLFSDPFSSRLMFPQIAPDSNTRAFSFQSSSAGFSSPGPDGSNRWVSQSTSTRTINGVTETIQTKVDSQGNQHVRRIYPDGQEKYTINGVEQPTRGYIPDAPTAGQLPPLEENAGYIPPPQRDDFSSPSPRNDSKSSRSRHLSSSKHRGSDRSKNHWWNRS